jgi:hypothetical protein
MPADCNVQIDPNGDTLEFDALISDIAEKVISSLPVYNGGIR